MSNIKAIKQGAILGEATTDIEKINLISKRELKPDDVYIFQVVLCDNEIDRDNEQFTANALNDLAPMFIGKPGIFDHNMTAKNQSARIFSTEIYETGSLNRIGEPYVQLRAKAYIPRIDTTKGLIDEIETGIKKEVSVNCSLKSSSCSICGGKRGCGHMPGNEYNGNICYWKLENPSDAYEWSFVAVPAQPAAGVIKNYNRKGEPEMGIFEKLFAKYLGQDSNREKSTNETELDAQAGTEPETADDAEGLDVSNEQVVSTINEAVKALEDREKMEKLIGVMDTKLEAAESELNATKSKLAKAEEKLADNGASIKAALGKFKEIAAKYGREQKEADEKRKEALKADDEDGGVQSTAAELSDDGWGVL